ncbi:MAG: lipoyl synthase [Polyangiaceae bacterium]|nr:lipoyl synthase [Polyangiaceae bacterium]
MTPPAAKPPWLKVKAPSGAAYVELESRLRALELVTVCREARCPNLGECWSQGTATVMLLGHTCTRACRFCAVTTGHPRGGVDPREPDHVARSAAQGGLRYVVLTMVNRDDLLDGGAAHVARTVERLHAESPGLLVETLVGDFAGRLHDVDVVLASRPDVFAHNVEVVRSLTPTIRDARAGYERSLAVLAHASRAGVARFVKSSLMVGIGETDDEVFETLADLAAAGVHVVTIGQYLRPTPRHAPVARYVEPERFREFADRGEALGLRYVAAGPLVRSSYHAAEAFLQAGCGEAPRAESGPALVPASRLARR